MGELDAPQAAGGKRMRIKRVSGKDMCKLLEGRGWLLDRVRGAHHIYRFLDGRTVPIPVHGNRTMKLGTQRSIMRLAGILTEAACKPSTHRK